MQCISCSIDNVLQKFGLSQANHDTFSSIISKPKEFEEQNDTVRSSVRQ